MKKRLVIFSLLGLLVLGGCGTSFTTSSATLEQYANENEYIYSDVSEDYADYGYITGVYVMEAENAHVELWEFDSAGTASQWMSGNVETIKEGSSSSSGSYTSSGGDYSITNSGTYYRIMFSDTSGIYAYGNKDSVNDALTSIGVIQ